MSSENSGPVCPLDPNAKAFRTGGDQDVLVLMIHETELMMAAMKEAIAEWRYRSIVEPPSARHGYEVKVAEGRRLMEKIQPGSTSKISKL